MRATRRVVFMMIGSALLLITQARAQEPLGHYPGEGVFRASLGSFEPRGDSQYWQDKEEEFFADASEFEDFVFDVDFLYFISGRTGLLLSLGGWEGEQTQSYRDFVDQQGREITHLTRLDQAWLDVGLVFHLLGRRAALMPYLGGGGSFVSYELEESGDFIDFSSSSLPVFRDSFFSSGDAFGYFLLAGVEVPLGRRFGLFAEGRWRHADDELDEDFAGLGSLDLSGRSLGIGFAVSF